MKDRQRLEGFVARSDGYSGKGPGELGIVAQRDGDINAFVHGDFLVN